jgi:uncharacterized protein (DUF1501 family)
MLIKRRDFLKISGLASASLMIPSFLQALVPQHAALGRQKKLIIIQLDGGNDGLNTIIPVRNDIYYQVRPQIALKKDQGLALNDELNLHANLPFFKQLYDQGQFSILNGVGYPNPDKSHFRSMDIWHSASDSQQYWQTGWLGRYLDDMAPAANAGLKAIEIDDLLSLALKGKQQQAMAFQNIQKLNQITQNKFYQQLQAKQHQHEHQQVGYLYKVMGNAMNNASVINQFHQKSKLAQTYPNTAMGKKLKSIAQLILSDIDTQVFYASMGSFDTHYQQQERQAKLFTELNDAVQALWTELQNAQKSEEVLVVIFSEFGRRLAENASKGTDHGTANPMFFIGAQLKQKGLLNASPNLSILEDGDLVHTEDFRQVYATILQNWLGADAPKILGKSFKTYDFL